MGGSAPESALPGRVMSFEVGRVDLKSLVMAASGTFGYGTEVPLLEREHLGGMVSKGIFMDPRPGAPPPRLVETPSGMLNAIGLQGPGVEALISDYAPLWAGWDFPVLVNINGESIDEYAELAARLDGVPGVAGLEINVSCPNVRSGGVYFGNDPVQAAAVTAAVRRRTRLPVWVKLTPAVTDIAAVARAVEAEGADALCAINTLTGTSFEISTGRPRLGFGSGGLSGPAIRPIAVHLARQVARSVTIPVIGIGGISSGDDALEFLFAGCSAVQVGTATFIDPSAISLIEQALVSRLSGLSEPARAALSVQPVAKSLS